MLPYAYTLQIPGGCKIYSNTDRRYRDLVGADQQKVLYDIISNNCERYHIEYTINYEQHKDGRYHIHGHISTGDVSQLIEIQTRINMFLGYDLKSQKQFYYKKVFYKDGWDKYVHKDILLHCKVPSDSDNE